MSATAEPARPAPLLQLEGVNTYYGQIHILQDSNLNVGEGELVCLLGGNASGKSTTLKTILGLVRPRTGAVRLAGEDVTRLPTAHRIRRGLAIVPENRRLFGPMTVLQNLEMGAYLRPRADLQGGVRARLLALPAPLRASLASSPARSPAASSRWSRWAAR